MRGHGHDGAGAVVGQHEVRDPDRNRLARERIAGAPPRVEAFLLDLAGGPRRAVQSPEAFQPRRERRRVGARRRQAIGQRVLGSEQHGGGAVDRVDARREHLDGVRLAAAIGLAVDERKPHQRARGAADPVALHRQHLLRPLIELVRARQQRVRVAGDAEEPLVQIAGAHLGRTAPAGAVHHLLVGQHRLAGRAPVDGRPLAVGEIALEHAEEQPLVPAVVVALAGSELALPGVADPEPLELALHVGDVVERPALGVGAVLDGRVLGRHAERVPAERMQHVVPLHPPGPGDHVADHVVADVTDVRVAGRVGEHHEAVELGAVGILGHLERAGGPPPLLPLPLDSLGIVVAHGRIHCGCRDYSPRQNGACARRTRLSAASARSVEPSPGRGPGGPSSCMTASVETRHASSASRS